MSEFAAGRIESGSQQTSVHSTPVVQKLETDESPIQTKSEYTNAELPAKPISAYWTVICLCLMIAFGGFVFGWDTGTISGFVNQTDFKRRFGQMKSDGTYYLSDVRTGLIVGIFNIGCALSLIHI